MMVMVIRRTSRETLMLRVARGAKHENDEGGIGV